MAATQKPAQKKQSTGFQGVRNAVWIIAAMFIVAVCIFKFVLGNPANFVGGDPEGEVLNGNMLGTIYKGGIVVPVLITLMLTVLCLSVERYLAQRTAFGKMATTKFVVQIKAALAKNDFVEAKNLCAKQRGTNSDQSRMQALMDEIEKIMDYKEDRLNAIRSNALCGCGRLYAGSRQGAKDPAVPRRLCPCGAGIRKEA